jgi:hypothetical protein
MTIGAGIAIASMWAAVVASMVVPAVGGAGMVMVTLLACLGTLVIAVSASP